MLAHELLPDSLTELCMDVLKQSAPSERELIRVIVEMIAELRDGEEVVDVVSRARSAVLVVTSLNARFSDEPTLSRWQQLSEHNAKLAAQPLSAPRKDSAGDDPGRAGEGGCRGSAVPRNLHSYVEPCRGREWVKEVISRHLLTLLQNFDENSTLEGLLADLIVPSVKRKELALRERGLVSLGLCCLIAKVCRLLVAMQSQR